ncbi:hypothetical protein SAY87_027895 [Trapa incisa]|uniref:Uncharacterized protein n=1 Tax=Trapa incisa TaxID=236973 RepID=A0AAN7QP31_9MYRT|nr:hypothetical protein SAY87_027895 [Trapa incisa]
MDSVVSRDGETPLVAILSCGFLLVFLCSESRHQSQHVFSLVASLVVRAVGSRNAILLGTAGYLLFIAAKLKPACANSLSPTLEQVYGKPHITCLVAKWRVELFFRVVFVSMLVKHSYSGALKYARPPHLATLLGIGNVVLDTAQCTPCFAIQAEHGMPMMLVGAVLIPKHLDMEENK